MSVFWLAVVNRLLWNKQSLEWVSGYVSKYSALQKTRDFTHFPFKMAIFEWGFWAIIALLFPWTPHSKEWKVEGFQKSTTCMYMCLKGLQSWMMSKFQYSLNITYFLFVIFSYENSATYEHFWFFEVLKLWQPVTLQPLEANGRVVPFWKPLISHCLEPDDHGGGRTSRA